MSVFIYLTRSDFNCLMQNTPPNSPLNAVFKTRKEFSLAAAELSGGIDVSLECTKDDAEALLSIATTSCPGTVHDITQALRRAGYDHG